MASPTEQEMQRRLAEHPELLDRLDKGVPGAFAEILEVVGGAKIAKVTVRELADGRPAPG